MTAQETWTVGQVAAEVGVSIRTLHHYDEIGLVVPGGRSLAGYRLYTVGDLTRLQHVVVYRSGSGWRRSPSCCSRTPTSRRTCGGSGRASRTASGSCRS
ncbi:MerR family transcriptional regulator [uncultured Serinicoccus sp.]|uniref:MerR family transcriptional regulator n=1 Tax=uncultured Serinicoccus sp. TaxID=735514 RepID=UPI003459BDF1